MQRAVRRKQSASSPLFSSYRQTAPASSVRETSAAESASRTGNFISRSCLRAIWSSTPDGLLIVDPHAAHERVNYERILKACADPRGQEKLIMPIPLPPTLKDDAMANRGKLAELNFAIDEDGSLSRLPVHASRGRFARRSAAQRAERDRGAPGTFRLAGQRLRDQGLGGRVKLTTRLEAAEAYQLLAELERCDQPNACPHGRPTVLRLTGGALDRHFGRLGL